MTVLFSDDFSGALDPGWVNGSGGMELTPPDTSGGVLRLHGPSAAFWAYSTSVVNAFTAPVRCSIWTWEIADLPLADIYAGEFFGGTLQAAGGKGAYRWNLRWAPSTVPPPEAAGTDTEVVLYPSWVTFYPPVSANGAGTPVAFDIADHKWLRIREECHDVLWQVSPDGATWTDVYTHTLDSAYVYASDYVMAIGMRSGYTQPGFHWDIEGVSIEKFDDCACPEVLGGWHVGRVAATNSGPW